LTKQSILIVPLYALAGKLPSDELVGEVLSFLKPRGIMNGEVPPKIKIPAEARQAFEAISGPSTSTLRNAGLLPLMTNSVEILEQVPLLIEEVSSYRGIFSDFAALAELSSDKQCSATAKNRWPMGHGILSRPQTRYEQRFERHIVPEEL
jgi:hypothetical protein